MKKPRAILFLLIPTIFLLSCVTSPKASGELDDGAPDFSLIPSSADIYLWADINHAKPLLEALSFEGLSHRDVVRIMDRTDTVLAAFYPEDASQRFFLAGWGNYPNLRAGFSMSFNRDWKRVKSETGSRYWYSGRNSLGIALGSSLALVSNGDPFNPGLGSDPCPPGFEEFRRSCVLSGWLNNPDKKINQFISTLGIPVQIPAEDFFFGVIKIPIDENKPDAGPWELVFKARTPNASQARSLIALFSLARMFMPRDSQFEFPDAISPQEAAGMLFARNPEQDGESIIFRIGPIDEGRIALLFNMFSLYSK